MNRLANSLSPYLVQHKDNPVDWWEWGPDAFEEARRRDVPILLSVGYAACHWCHVMAHESFEDPGVAEAVNGGFVPVKVDREERPDVDAVYMTATTALTGQGGWPMTCFLTPTGEPFYCGTYFPRDHFLALLDAIATAWDGQREEVLASSSHIAEQLRGIGAPQGVRSLDEAALESAVATLRRQFDGEHGGFGGAPKFPPSMVLELLLRHHARTGSQDALEMAERTCEAMARGGMYDQLGGGFARYSVDIRWVVPHFEKMLYDNAQLLRVYAHLYRATGGDLARRVATQTAEFLLRDLRTPQGAFASSLDADTDGEEGLTYVWSPAQLEEVLGPQDGPAAAALLSVTRAGTFEHGTSTLQLRADPEDAAWWSRVRTRLFEARSLRPQPARDDKVVTSWNGLAIAALADAGAILEQPDWVAAAGECATHLLTTHLDSEGRLLRVSRDGLAGAAAGVADDYGNLAEGLVALCQADGQARWLSAARELLATALAGFGAADGGFHDTADTAPSLFTRPRSTADNAEPSGQSALAGALLACSALTGDSGLRAAADKALESSGPLAAQEPRFGGWALAVAEAALAGPLQVAVVAPDDTDPGGQELARVAIASTSPGQVVMVGRPDAEGHPLLAGRPLVGGGAAAYVCRGFVCDAPVTDPADLRAALRR